MSDSGDQRFGAGETVSIRAVVVRGDAAQADVHAALAEAGIYDAWSVPAVHGEEPDLSVGLLGDGVTPNLVGALEADVAGGGAEDAGADGDADSGSAGPAAAESGWRTGMLPAAFGGRPLAPVRVRGDG